MTTPNAMPKKTNSLHLQLLSALIDTKPVSWIHKRLDPDSPNPQRPDVIETKMPGIELRSPLAQNVSALSVERAAKRWL